MKTEAKHVGDILVGALSDVQTDMKWALSALALSLFESGALKPELLEKNVRAILDKTPEANRTPQAHGIQELLLDVALAAQAKTK